jgi:hypothetical protein
MEKIQDTVNKKYKTHTRNTKTTQIKKPEKIQKQLNKLGGL